ncbi:bifunctional adenosylcobinamide kinase/adenosylcobinamide-phosphate guanylyltransferase [Janibacter hoylei]|uniref:bifunctional adenosylcobinamide kinase/adenosylcobinamide-phosphate guanylyltransferase n=1 Tax=Janibacter hoylei TaxID=364298 RepID=UPI002237F03D|nr:bifunctional adenosylcobinamide kinase/adenosylcobinamide-phosphate guanylyltransferase [Janibacter hoylei]MCW4602757.1 bifunctional adenosylcobinamide kinase/adenosylcobinamide-phosphate guanylyltransferase [Janibacter hoylei]
MTNEVGWGLVSEHRSGRIFADRLGWLNERIASASDRVDLVVSGQVLTIKAPA